MDRRTRTNCGVGPNKLCHIVKHWMQSPVLSSFRDHKYFDVCEKYDSSVVPFTLRYPLALLLSPQPWLSST
jgi:hypothetical protein